MEAMTMNSISAKFRSNTLRVVAVLALLATQTPARAQWPACGRGVGTGAVAQRDHAPVTADGGGGANVVWGDFRGGGLTTINIFARRVLANGELDPAWPAEGRALVADPSGLGVLEDPRVSPAVVSDGAGGAIVAWEDGRSLVTGIDIYAQHVLASGAVDPAWPASGRALVTTPDDQGRLALIADGAGGGRK